MEKIKAVANHIASIRNNYEGMVIVASAMGTTTDSLINMAKQAGKHIPKRELDVLLATGEQQTVALLSIALQNLGIDAQSMTGFQSGFMTNKRHANAKIESINTAKVEEIINSGKVAIVAGFQGIDEDGDITTLGRGGSDITAVGIAAHLGWDCELYTTTSCMYTIDPEIYPDAKQIKYITYEEMMEIANLGADKIETRAVELAMKYNVKLFLGKSLESDKSKGTYIMSRDILEGNKELMVEDMPITGMGMQDEVSIFTLRKVPADGMAVAECFAILAELHINVDMISQQMSEDGSCTVSFSCDAKEGKTLYKELKARDAFKGIDVSCECNLSMISLIGVGMATNSGVASKVFKILADSNVKYHHITTSEISISVTVAQEQKLKAAIALCREFHL